MVVRFELDAKGEVVYETVINEIYQKSGLRRISVNEHLLVDPYGRFIICGAVE